ncbi:MAG: hypothetical protein BV459_08480 [Thermoplasmata archaeon M11B2D]|nr:MAG: hypothetical protein BV459_08480 [Thermoplasmata archaeon M11B2D]
MFLEQRNKFFNRAVVMVACMGKNKDLLKVLLLILVGMFIPFLGSIALSYGFVPQKIVVTFLYFLVIFGLELGCVYLYFTVSGRRASRKMEQYKPK